MICPAVRFPSSPPIPDAQNLHPTGQPSWLEMHAVRRDSAGIKTHSVSWPRATFDWPTIGSAPVVSVGSAVSAHETSNFCVPSLAD